MIAGFVGGAAVGGAPGLVVVSFAGPVVYRNVRTIARLALWHPSRPGLRWNPTFPALYTSLQLETSLAERLKHSAPIALEVTVGIAHVVAHRVADLTRGATLQHFQTSGAALVRDDYDEPTRIAEIVHRLDVGGLLVPAAIEMVVRKFPRMQLMRDGLRIAYEIPRTGVNLVLFPDRYQEFRELERYSALLRGLTR
jgi:hypothetical protein